MKNNFSMSCWPAFLRPPRGHRRRGRALPSPPDFDLIVPAEAGSLAIVRRQLRSWLGMTGRRQ